MTISTADPSRIASHRDIPFDNRTTAVQYGQALAYAWGAQDYAPAGDRDTGASTDFAGAYALAGHLSDGTQPPLQDAYVTWVQTGRLVVRVPGTFERPDAVVQIAVEREPGRPTSVAARLLPWAASPFCTGSADVRYVPPSR